MFDKENKILVVILLAIVLVVCVVGMVEVELIRDSYESRIETSKPFLINDDIYKCNKLEVN